MTVCVEGGGRYRITMIADGYQELHDAASAMGGIVRYLGDASNPQYSLTPEQRTRALANGAVPVGRDQLHAMMLRGWRPANSGRVGMPSTGSSTATKPGPVDTGLSRIPFQRDDYDPSPRKTMP